MQKGKKQVQFSIYINITKSYRYENISVTPIALRGYKYYF